jgi:hypothetical protein
MTRADLHRLVDGLPDEALDSAARLLERATDPMIWMLDAAPLDDEPFTEEEQAEVERARQALRRGEGIPLEQLMSELDEAG